MLRTLPTGIFRKNINLKILLFNNRIYGLTKGQYSPTSEQGKITKSTPQGSLDYSFNPVSVALGAEATFVARTIDSDRQHLSGVLAAAAAHEGTALVEIYQNCNIFNDNAWEPLKDNDVREENLMRLVHGEPIIFGSIILLLLGARLAFRWRQARAAARSLAVEASMKEPG